MLRKFNVFYVFAYFVAGSKHGKVTSISLDPPPVGACTFPKGKNVTATINMEIGKF